MQRLAPIFISAALIFTAYAVMVQYLPFTIEKGQNQGDTNMLRAQEYLARPDRGTALVGSSLTFRLPPSALGPDIANLAMAGGAPATGLALIDASAGRPKLVLVEINLLSRGADMSAIQSLLRFPERQSRSFLRALRTGYDPVNLIGRGIQAALHKEEVDLVPPPDAVRRLIASQRRDMEKPPDLTNLRRNLSEIGSLVARLEARGVRVGFFEMPIDASLTDLPDKTALRQVVLTQFPRDRFCWLTLGIAGGAHTLDGIHLRLEDATLVARQIVDQRRACLRH